MATKIPWHGEDNSARDSERSKKEEDRKDGEDNIKEWTGMEFGDSLRAAEDGEWWKGVVAMSFCGAPTTFKVKGLRWDDINNISDRYKWLSATTQKATQQVA